MVNPFIFVVVGYIIATVERCRKRENQTIEITILVLGIFVI